MYYRNDSLREPYPQHVPGCNGLNPCPLSVFNELVRDVVAEDWEDECGFKTKWSSTGEDFSNIFTIALISINFYILKCILAALILPCVMFIPVFALRTNVEFAQTGLFENLNVAYSHVRKGNCHLPQVS